MSRMKLRITGQSNQVLRHLIRSCYGMILQVCKGNKEFSNKDRVVKLLLQSEKSGFLCFFKQILSGNGINQRTCIIRLWISIYGLHLTRFYNPSLFHNQYTVTNISYD